MLLIIAFATFVAALLGGFVAIRLKDRLHLILGFSAGAVIGVAFFDLLPEAMEVGSQFYSLSTISGVVALGFLIYLVLDRVILLHGHTHSQHHESSHQHTKGVLGAGSLAVHSFFDGIGIGLAFQASPAVGLSVAAAVLAHNFSDGINTVNFLLKNKGNAKTAYQWLLVSACAPALGMLSTMLFVLPQQYVGVVLALFTGFFLYLGASDLIPESHHSHPKLLTTLMTLLGAGVLFAAIRFAGI
jgi:zinc transporter ZupT